jgi:DeoR family transcriptional regulator of aga operon
MAVRLLAQSGALFDPSLKGEGNAALRGKTMHFGRSSGTRSRGSMCAIDSGTTTTAAKALKRFSYLTVITNAVNISGTDLEVILPEALCAEIRFRRLDPKCAQIYFLGIDGFDIEMGLTTPNVIESRVNLAMVKAATNIVSVCDSAKFNTRSLSKIVDVASIHHVITDSNLLKTVAEGIRNFRCQANFGLARLSRRHDSMVIGHWVRHHRQVARLRKGYVKCEVRCCR